VKFVQVAPNISVPYISAPQVTATSIKKFPICACVGTNMKRFYVVHPCCK